MTSGGAGLQACRPRVRAFAVAQALVPAASGLIPTLGLDFRRPCRGEARLARPEPEMLQPMDDPNRAATTGSGLACFPARN